MYTEPQVMEMLKKLTAIYLESWPDDKEAIDRFRRWTLLQYGYKDVGNDSAD